MRQLGSEATFDNIYTELYRLKVEELVELLKPDGRPIPFETSELNEKSNKRIWKQLNFGHEKHNARVAWMRRINQLPDMHPKRTILKRYLCKCGEVRQVDGSCCVRRKSIEPDVKRAKTEHTFGDKQAYMQWRLEEERQKQSIEKKAVKGEQYLDIVD